MLECAWDLKLYLRGASMHGQNRLIPMERKICTTRSASKVGTPILLIGTSICWLSISSCDLQWDFGRSSFSHLAWLWIVLSCPLYFLFLCFCSASSTHLHLLECVNGTSMS
ncbi:hypothetical protein B0H19DRAFT_449838 [Mycena capillaripes]|nr:hypothetical protein B0H19DRAFT_449838 [Mycena capillaripes]